MKKIKEQMAWRDDGMAYALRIAEQKGIEGLRKEIEYRKAAELSVKLTKEEQEELVKTIKHNVADGLMTLFMAVLHDEFGFGHDRLLRFARRADMKAEGIAEGIEWYEYADVIAQETGMAVPEKGNLLKGRG